MGERGSKGDEDRGFPLYFAPSGLQDTKALPQSIDSVSDLWTQYKDSSPQHLPENTEGNVGDNEHFDTSN
tara:strand:+ start:26 stop:235 length:210 start_codon:yes stop_codon:yes gene_type:complete